MKFRFVSVLPLVLLSVGCSDDESTSSSLVDAGSDRDGAVASEPRPDASTPVFSNVDAAAPHDNLTLGLAESVDELTIVEDGFTGAEPDATATAATNATETAPRESSEVTTTTSRDVATSSSHETTSHAETTIETDVVTLVFDTESDAGTGSTAETTTTVQSDASADVSDEDTSDLSDSDAGSPSTLLEGCLRVSGERPATTPTVSAPQVAGLNLGPGVAGAPLNGGVQFQDNDGDATTLIVQVGSADEHYLCTLSAEDLEQGSTSLGVLSLSNTFPDGGHTLYVGLADAAGNVSGYIAGSLTLGDGGAQSICGQAARLVIGAVPSQGTTFYAENNGFSTDYDAGDPLAVVASTDLFLKLDGCTELLLSGDAAGEAAVGWDNCLLVEYRPSPNAPREAVWSYCSLGIWDVATNSAVPSADEPATVPGTALYPPVPNAAPFGWAALTLDLMRYVPEGHPNEFVLNLRLLDFGNFGSTTDIWVTAQESPTVPD